MTARVLKAPDVVVNEPVDDALTGAFQQAIEDAFARGRQFGAEEATRQLERELASLRSALEASTSSARAAMADQAALDADTIASLAFDVANWYLEDLADHDPLELIEGVRAAVAGLADATELVLYVHPTVCDALGGDTSFGVHAVRADASLGITDFRLNADGTVVERRWLDAVADVRDALIAALRSSRTAGTGPMATTATAADPE